MRYKVYGSDIEQTALDQMERAAQLPISVRGALMPDAHTGYGLPIGGVLATNNAVIPYAVGMDIACRMRITVLDIPVSALENKPERLRSALGRETSFGVGASFEIRRYHQIMESERWVSTPLLKGLHDKAWSQLGTSGSGNHFVEFGILTVYPGVPGLEQGEYLALLSHGGSRGSGSDVAKYYSKLAAEQHPELTNELKELAWLELDSAEGQEYWNAMQLMGDYAAANHELIHDHILASLGAEPIVIVENHHNFAWKETHDGKDVIVHRKGATPAGEGVLGVIPGSMGTPGYVVRGLGNPDSLCSASHGAGRAMSRKRAKELYNWEDAKKFLDERRVEIISAGLDEVPMAYKDIEEVMAAQVDLVEPIARFDPRLVKMAPERARWDKKKKYKKQEASDA